MLYREIPVTTFEAQRQKEQLLVDRGNEYVRAIQLFYRRNRGQFPASIEQLEDTNRIRYLRHRFKDPLTGKDDWRLLHAGPNGILTDSKVTPLGNASDSGQSGTGQTSGIGLRAGNGLGSGTSGLGSFGSSQSSDSGPDVVVPRLPQRPPAVLASQGATPTGDTQPGDTPTSAALDQNPATPLLATNQPSAANELTPSRAAGPGGLSPVNPSQLGASAGGTQQPQGSEVAQNLFNGPTLPQKQAVSFGTNSRRMGQMMGGALAGVASRAEGQSIKLVDDQSDYSLWEFHYDPTKDRSMGLPGNLQPGGGAPGTLGKGPPGNAFGNNAPGSAAGASSPGADTSPDATPDQPQAPGTSAPPSGPVNPGNPGMGATNTGMTGAPPRGNEGR